MRQMLLALLLVSPAFGEAGDITTIAGGYTGDGGAATEARLNAPRGVALDSVGNTFLADTAHDRIRRIDARTGVITTVAGSGETGYSGDDGRATEARLNRPEGIFVDDSGNLYIADTNNNVIRRVNGTTGVITTIAGDAGSSSFGVNDGGGATEGLLLGPTDVALDKDGNLYIADASNTRVRRVDTLTGIITTYAGGAFSLESGDGGPATDASLRKPYGIAISTSGDLYIADQSGRRVRKVDAGTGIISTVAGTGSSGDSGDGGPASEALLKSPSRLAIGGVNTLYISDWLGARVRAVALDTGTISLSAGGGSGGSSVDGILATDARLIYPRGIAIGGDGSLVIAEDNSALVRKVDAQTGLLSTIAGSMASVTVGIDGAPLNAALYNPADVAADSAGNVYFVDGQNNRVLKVDPGGQTLTRVAGQNLPSSEGDGGPAADAGLNKPNGIALDASGNIYLADTLNNRVRRVDAETGIITTVAGVLGIFNVGYSGDGGPGTDAQLQDPWDICIGSDGVLYIADRGNDVIRALDTSTGIIGSVFEAGTLDSPSGVALDGEGNLVIADYGNGLVRRWNTSTNELATVAGSPDFPFDPSVEDGLPATGGRLLSPTDVAVDAAGDIYILEVGSRRVRRVGSDGVITSVAGIEGAFGDDAPERGYSGDGGPATEARLNPLATFFSLGGGIAISGGDLYIADGGNHRIRKVEGVASDNGGSTPIDSGLPTDFNDDGRVDFGDFLEFVGHFGARQGDSTYGAAFDLNNSGRIDFEDFLLFVADFGK